MRRCCWSQTSRQKPFGIHRTRPWKLSHWQYQGMPIFTIFFFFVLTIFWELCIHSTVFSLNRFNDSLANHPPKSARPYSKKRNQKFLNIHKLMVQFWMYMGTYLKAFCYFCYTTTTTNTRLGTNYIWHF